MNYRHAYHAGNFADVLKHAVLALTIEHLKQKPAAFRVIDTHAGTGAYDLASEESGKTGEWREGIGRLIDAELPASVAGLLEPYLAVVRKENPDGGLTRYPGSPLIARRLIRRNDRLIVNELHADDVKALRRLFAADTRTTVLSLDAWMALKALLPPKERRGVVLVDPPFEQPGEFTRLAQGLREAWRRFATGTVIVWYPLKDARLVSAFRRELADLGVPKLLSAELLLGGKEESDGLGGTGLVVLNPPFQLDEKLARLLPYLAATVGRGRGAHHRLDWLTKERVTSS
jgi:23S rRNA (adenine2030-N6)-methyltransferase